MSNIEMYQIREIIEHDNKIQLPKCMYHMKNIHSTREIEAGSNKNGMVNANPPKTSISTINDQVKQFLKQMEVAACKNDCDEMERVFNKQYEVLNQLDELQLQLNAIRKELKSKTNDSPNKKTKLNIGEVIMNAHPDFPPYSLFILSKFISNLTIQFHIHSSVQLLSYDASEFMGTMQRYESDSSKGFHIRVIWKDIGCNQMEFFISNTKILGECNFLRYIARLCHIMNYDESNNEIDAALDIAYGIIKSRTKTERSKLLRTINALKGKSKYMFGDCWNLADVALYSAIKQTTPITEVNVGLTKWLQECESI